MSESDMMIIGIAGGTGSGKTTITRRLIQNFGSEVSVIHHDNYYKAHHDMPYEERAKLNYDHPNSFDTDLLIRDLKELRQGRTITCPVYDYAIHDRTDKTVTVRPTRVIVVEGILIYENRELCDQMDIKLFVDTDADVRILRRIVRDVRDRGRSLESVINQYHHADAEGVGIVGIVDLDFLAVFFDDALLGLIQTEQNAHQGGFACAVLTQQGVDLAPFQLQGDVVVGDDAGKALRDVKHLDCVWTLQPYQPPYYLDYLFIIHYPTAICK